MCAKKGQQSPSFARHNNAIEAGTTHFSIIPAVRRQYRSLSFTPFSLRVLGFLTKTGLSLIGPRRKRWRIYASDDADKDEKAHEVEQRDERIMAALPLEEVQWSERFLCSDTLFFARELITWAHKEVGPDIEERLAQKLTKLRKQFTDGAGRQSARFVVHL